MQAEIIAIFISPIKDGGIIIPVSAITPINCLRKKNIYITTSKAMVISARYNIESVVNILNYSISSS